MKNVENQSFRCCQIMVLFAVVVLFSCQSENKTQTGIKSSGKTAEFLVVTANSLNWEGSFGDAVQTFSEQEYQILNQPEPIFEVGHIPQGTFQDSRMFKSHHNILIAGIDAARSQPVVEVQIDYWATPQRVIRLVANNEAAVIELFEDNAPYIEEVFRTSDREKLAATFRAFKERKVMTYVEENFNLRLDIPSGFYIAKKYSEFGWIRKETPNNSQGLIICSYDYIDTSSFHPARIIAYRNAITREYIPGPSYGSYMVVSEDPYPPVFRELDFKGMYAVETRGLWSVKNDFMSGPFVSYTFVDEKRNKVITVDGYVYAPNAPKRDLLIQMEAIIHSLDMVP